MKTHLAATLIAGCKAMGSFKSEHVMPYIEESLTVEEAKNIEKFLDWTVLSNKPFGHNNIDLVFALYMKTTRPHMKTLDVPESDLFRINDLSAEVAKLKLKLAATNTALPDTLGKLANSDIRVLLNALAMLKQDYSRTSTGRNQIQELEARLCALGTRQGAFL